jgi:hypothetical protein
MRGETANRGAPFAERALVLLLAPGLVSKKSDWVAIDIADSVRR